MASGITPIKDLLQGWFRGYRNEVALDTKPEFHDPVKYRGGAWWTDSWLVLVGGDLLSGDPNDPRRNERGIFGIRHNDSYPKADNAQEFAVIITDPGQEGDEYQRCVLRLTSSFLELFGRKVNLDSITTAPTGRFYSPNRQWCWNYQDDGSVVLYDTHNNPDETTWTAKYGLRPNGVIELP